MSNDIVVCSNGHVYDMSGVIADPKQLAAITWCPKLVGDDECGGLCVWKNPIKSIDKK
jgi:hypothetical protein